MTTPGDLNRRLVLEAPAEADDGAGGVTRLYDVVTTLWAQVVPRSAVGITATDRVGAVVRYRVIVRARQDITIKHLRSQFWCRTQRKDPASNTESFKRHDRHYRYGRRGGFFGRR